MSSDKCWSVESRLVSAESVKSRLVSAESRHSSDGVSRVVIQALECQESSSKLSCFDLSSLHMIYYVLYDILFNS